MMILDHLWDKIVSNTSQNATVDAQQFRISTKALAVTSVINGTLLLFTTLVFSFLRHKLPRVYTPRRLLLHGPEFFSKMPQNYFGWVYPAFKLRDEDILTFLGLDALMFLRYLRLCLKLGIVMLPYGLLVALPVNYSGGVSENDSSISGLDRFTMGNVIEMSDKLLVHFFGVWLYTLLVLFLLYREYLAYQGYRQTSLSNGSKYPHRYLVMLCDIPQSLRNQDNMKEYVNKCFPGQMLDAYVLEENKRWKQLVEKYEKAQRALESAKAVYRIKGKRPICRPAILKFSTHKVDSINYHEDQVIKIKGELEEERRRPHKLLNHSFVAYKTLKDATIAGNSLAWDFHPYQLRARMCPEKDDLVWENLSRHRLIRFLLTLVMDTIVQFLMIFFWTIPVGLASTMVSMEQLQKKIPFLQHVDKLGPVVTGFISGFLSTVVVVVFFAILPMILAFLAYIKGTLTYTQIHNDVLEKLFVFKVMNQFVLFILGNTMMQRLGEILDHPSQIPDVMAKEMPTAADFFMNFIMLKATTIYGFELLRVFPLFVITIRRKFFVKNAIEDKECWEPPEMWFSQQYAEILLVFLITLTYSVLAPLVVPFAVLYFAFGYVTWLNQLVFVYVPKWEGDGQMWPIVFHRTMVAICVFLFFMIGLFSLKKSSTIATLTIPLLVICIIFWYKVNHMFKQPSASPTFKSLTMIRDLDPDLIKKTFTTYLQNHNIPDLLVDRINNGLSLNKDDIPENDEFLNDVDQG